ncbi:MAG: phosphatidylglycerophosphatase A [bacterium]|nr:phosphatidylglycerophosphatase A [bacterium]
MNPIWLLIGSGIYTGYSPFAPGTAGTALCFLVFWFIPGLSVIEHIITTAVLIVLGVISSNHLEKHLEKDSSIITIDEIAGMAIALIMLPKSVFIWLAAFVLFRLFDIFKPPPIKSLEFLPGGFGVMGDDIAAGIYANLCCQIIVWLI